MTALLVMFAAEQVSRREDEAEHSKRCCLRLARLEGASMMAMVVMFAAEQVRQSEDETEHSKRCCLRLARLEGASMMAMVVMFAAEQVRQSEDETEHSKKVLPLVGAPGGRLDDGRGGHVRGRTSKAR